MKKIATSVSFAENPPLSIVDVNPMSKLLINRRVWVIRDLIDKPLRQKDIKELWMHRGEVQFEEYEKLILNGKSELVNVPTRCSIENGIGIWKPKKVKDGIGISKSSISKIFNGDYKHNHTGLLEEGIVDITIVEKEVGYYLVKNHEALFKILLEFNNPKLPKFFQWKLKNVLMNSEYAKNLINKDLVEKIEFEDDHMNENEIEFVFTIIKISSSALLTVLQKLHDQGPDGWRELSPEKEKQNFLSDLQFKLYQDSIDQKITDKLASYPIPVQVEFNIKSSIKTENNEFQYISTIKKSSEEFLSEEEREEEIKKIENMFGEFEKSQEQLIKRLKKSIDVPFDLNTSPLTYEKKLNIK